MANVPVTEVVQVDAVLDGLSSPTSSQVWDAVEEFSDTAIAVAAARRSLAASGGSRPGNGYFKRVRNAIAFDDMSHGSGQGEAPLYTLAADEVIDHIGVFVPTAFDDSAAGNGGDILTENGDSFLSLAIPIDDTTGSGTGYRAGINLAITTGTNHTAYKNTSGANIEGQDAGVDVLFTVPSFAFDGAAGEIVIDLYVWVPTA